MELLQYHFMSSRSTEHNSYLLLSGGDIGPRTRAKINVTHPTNPRGANVIRGDMVSLAGVTNYRQYGTRVPYHWGYQIPVTSEGRSGKQSENASSQPLPKLPSARIRATATRVQHPLRPTVKLHDTGQNRTGPVSRYILSPKASSYMRLQLSCSVGCVALYPTALDFWKG